MPWLLALGYHSWWIDFIRPDYFIFVLWIVLFGDNVSEGILVSVSSAVLVFKALFAFWYFQPAMVDPYDTVWFFTFVLVEALLFFSPFLVGRAQNAFHLIGSLLYFAAVCCIFRLAVQFLLVAKGYLGVVYSAWHVCVLQVAIAAFIVLVGRLAFSASSLWLLSRSR